MVKLLANPAVVLFKVVRTSSDKALKIVRRNRIGLTPTGDLLWTKVSASGEEPYTGTDPLRFDYIQFLDKNGNVRLSSHVWAGKVESGRNDFRIAFDIFSPLVDVARGAGPIDKTRNCYNLFDLEISEKNLFAADGSVQLKSFKTRCVSYGAYDASFGAVSLAELTRVLPEKFEPVPSTDWPDAIDEDTFPFIYRLLGGRTAGLSIEPISRKMAKLRTGTVALSGAGAAKTRLGFESAAVIKGNSPRTLVLDPIFAADDPLNLSFTPRGGTTVVRVVSDANYAQSDIGPESPELGFDEVLPWYVVVEHVPLASITSVWNELVARPYLRSLRAIEDASDLSFVPLFTPIADGKSDECDILFDVMSKTPETLSAHPGGSDIVDPDKPQRGDERGGEFGAPVAISFWPRGSATGTFTADATFPGLITHGRKAIKRRVTVTVGPNLLECFDEKADLPKAQLAVTIKSTADAGKSDIGGKLRVGALDLVAPGKLEEGDKDASTAGEINLTFVVTFDAADPLADGDGSEKGRLRGRRVRARLPRRGEAIPRISTVITKFELSDVLPGSQDPVPDAGAAFDAVVEELVDPSDAADPRSARERRIRANLTRSAPIVLTDTATSPRRAVTEYAFFLTGREITEKDKNRNLILTLRRKKHTTGASDNVRTIVIDQEPMAVGLVDVPAFELSADDQGETDGEIANWQTSEAEGARWEIARVSEGFDLYLPPQATGEAAEKGYPWNPVSPSDNKATTVDYRLGTQAHLKLRSSYFKQRYSEAPWNLRRVLGYPGQRAPGASLMTARFEFLYGLGARFSGGSMRLAELGTRLGAIRDPLPARPLNIMRPAAPPHAAKQSDVEAEIYDRFRDASAGLTKTYNTRVGLLEAYREGGDGTFSAEEGVAFALRINSGTCDADLDKQPWNPKSNEAGLKGGATWGFESRNIYEEVVPAGRPPESTRGQIVGPAFSALGGSGFMRAFFASGKSRIVSTSRFGRTSNYSLERIGRIGVFWNIAKHVIVYERTVLPSDQFDEQQKGQHIGRPMLRKVKEYVDILELERTYPEKDAPLKTRGFVEACVFRTRRIPVNGQWGHDVPGGWVVPLWKADADPDLYPKPDARLTISAAQSDAAWTIPGRFRDPSQLFFYTSTEAQTDNPNLWPAHEGVDFVNLPKPAPVGRPTLDPSDPDGMAPSDMMRDPLIDRCTFDIDTSGQAASLAEGRTNGDRIGAVIETVSMARAAPTAFSDHKAAPVVDLRQEIERIAASVRAFDKVLNEGLARARRLLTECLVNDPRTLKARILQETDRLRESKSAVRRAAAEARVAIAEAADRAKQVGSRLSKWEESALDVRATLQARAIDEIEKRFKIVFQVFEDLKSDAANLVEGGKEFALRGLDDAYRPVERLLAAGSGTLASVTDQVSKAVAAVEGGIAATRAMLATRKAEIEKAIDALAEADQALKSKLVTLIDQFSSSATDNVRALEQAVDRLPRRVGAITRDALRNKLQEARKTIAELRASAVTAVIAQSGAARAKSEAKTRLAAVATPAATMLDALDTDIKKLRDLLDPAEAKVAELLNKVRSQWDAQRTQIEAKFDGRPETIIEAIKSIALPDRPQIAAAVLAVTGNLAAFADQLDAQLDSVTQDVGQIVDRTAALARVGVDELEKRLQDAIDTVVDQLLQAADGIAGALQKAAQALQDEGKKIGDLLNKPEYAGVHEAKRLVEEGYARLSQAPTFQNPSETLSLIRAAGSSPILPNLRFNRERIAYFFDDAREAIRTTPVVALMNRLGDDLKALGIRLPTSELLDRLVPSELEKFDFGNLFPDLGGLKLDGLFKNLRLPSSINDNVKVTHGFNKASLTAWAKAEAKSNLPPRSEVFSFGPLNLAVVNANFSGNADVTLMADGTSKRKTSADIVGDWELGFAGRTLVTLEKTRIHYEDGKGLDVDIDPSRVRLDSAVRFLSDIIKSYSEPNSGFFLEMMEEGGLPAGLAARLDLPMSPLSFGAFSIWGLRFTTAFGLHLPMASGKRDFAISTQFALGRKTEPFILRVWILVGGGWLETEAKYFPTTGRTVSKVSVGLTAGLGLDFAFGPCRGYVFVMFGVYAEFDSQSQLTIAVMFLVRGGIVILGRFNIGLNLLLELVYQDDGSAVGHGTLELTFTICWCCKITVRQSVTYNLRKGSQVAGMGGPDKPHYLDHFA